MDAQRFIALREPGWARLEAILESAEPRGARNLSHAEARELAALYRQASSDLIEVRSQVGSFEIERYLNALVARAYGFVYAAPRVQIITPLLNFLARDFPAALYRHGRVILAAVAIFLAGASASVLYMLIDEEAGDFLVPAQFDVGDHFRDPRARVESEERRDPQADEDEESVAVFSAFLFTNNSRVAFLAFACGISGGILTAIVLFYNGLILGAFVYSYVAAGETLFLFAWLLPHGVPELGSVFIAGGAGFLLGRAIIAPGRLSRAESLRLHGREAVLLVLGTIPLLLLAGAIESTLSQMHEPVVRYWHKLAFAGVEALGLAAYIARGRTHALSNPTL